MFVLRQRFLGWRNLSSSSRVLLPTLPASEAKEMGIKWDEANFVHYVEQDQMVEALQKYVTVKTPAGNYRDTKTKLNVPFADREAVKAKNARFDSETLSWYAPAGVDLNEFNVWLKEPKKVYLQVPFAEKDEVKLLGAQFDRATSKWYLDASRQDRAIFSKWAEWDPNAPPAPGASPGAARPSTPPAHRHFLNVPFAEKDEVKGLGARFDSGRKKWYYDRTKHSPGEFAKWKAVEREHEDF